MKDAPKLFVYTMGKVASSSVSESLIKAGIPCLDTHILAPRRVVTLLDLHLDYGDFAKIPPHFIRALQAHNSITYNDRVKIISLLREPVSRNISAVFQNIPEKFKNNRKEIVRRLKNYNPEAPKWWFQNDFIPATGIDVFASDHDPRQNYAKFSGEKCDVLFLKVETDDEEMEQHISDFIGQKFKLTRSNVGGDKWYRDIYAEMRANPELISENYLEECFNLEYFKKFYSFEERKSVAEKVGYSLDDEL